MENINEAVIFAKYYDLIEKFRGKKGIGMGDVRAYVSALVDLNIIENGIKSRYDLIETLSLVLKGISTGKINDNYNEVIGAWDKADKSILASYSKKVKCDGIEIGKRFKDNGYSGVSLFTGSYGLDLGFEYAGFHMDVALDIDPASEKIVTENRPNLPFILDDVANITTEEILDTAGILKGELDVLTGGPPCQPFSTAGKREGLNDPRASPLKEYIRVINEAQPKVFVMEEVTGLLNARIKHVPIKDRGNCELQPEEMTGSVWKVIMDELHKTGYSIEYNILDAADYGTPQKRRRVILVGFRPDLKVQKPLLPQHTHKKPNLPSLLNAKPWKSLSDTIMGVDIGDLQPLSPKYQKYMPYVPPGGNWRQLPEELKEEAMNKAYYAGGGKMGFYRRLSWFEPSPTLVTGPAMKSTMMIHPWEDRPLSVNEYKLIQGFPIDWLVPGSVTNKYRKIGEAVPPTLSYAIANRVKNILELEDNSECMTKQREPELSKTNG